MIKERKLKKVRIKRPYSKGEELASSISHLVGVVLSVGYFVLLLIKGINEGIFLGILANLLFAVCSFMLYLSSTIYHGLEEGSLSKKVWHRFDYVGIYLLIAGTYTPFTLKGIQGVTGFVLFAIIWLVALMGIILKVVYFDRFQKLHLINFLILGWIAIIFMKRILDNIGPAASLLLILGGVSYTVGVIFYSLKKYKYTHLVWHIFVLMGTFLHFLCIYLYL